MHRAQLASPNYKLLALGPLLYKSANSLPNLLINIFRRHLPVLPVRCATPWPKLFLDHHLGVIPAVSLERKISSITLIIPPNTSEINMFQEYLNQFLRSTIYPMGRSKMQPGEHNIDRVKATKMTGRNGGVVIRWLGVLKNGKQIQRRSQGSTAGQARLRARLTWDKACREAETLDGRVWTTQDSLTAFIDEVVKPAVDESGRRPNTITRYNEVLSIYRRYTDGQSLFTHEKASHIKNTLRKIALDIGAETSRQTRSVVSHYLIGSMIEHGLLDHNPIHGLSMPFTKSQPKEEDLVQIPTVPEWRLFLDFVLNEDDPNSPMPGKTTPQSKKLSARQRHARVIQLTQLQLATGLRISEALGITWRDVTADDNGDTWVTVSSKLSKTKIGRTVPVLIKQVSDNLWARHGEPDVPVIPQPTGLKHWDRAGATKAVREYYSGLASTRKEFTFLEKNRSHVWRKTLTTATKSILPPHIQAAYFGHTEDVSNRSYTDSVNVRPVISAAQDLFKSTS